MKMDKLDEFGLSGDNLIPDYVIDTFCERIKRLLNDGCSKDSPSIQSELNRIKTLNAGKIPMKVQSLLL